MASKIEHADDLVDAAGEILESEAKPGKLEQVAKQWNIRRGKTISSGLVACEVCGRPIKNFASATKIVGQWVGPECVKKLRSLGYEWEGEPSAEKAPTPAEVEPPRKAKRIAKAPGPPGSKYARDIFKAHLDELNAHVEKNGIGGLDKLYDRARAELGRQAAKLGPKSSPIAAASVGVMKDQVHAVLQTLGGDLQKHLLDTSKGAAELGVQHASAEMGLLGEVFEAGGEGAPFPVLAVEGPAIAAGLTEADPSLLRRHAAQSGTYSSAVIGEAEQQIAVSHMIGKPLHETIDEVQKLIDDSRWKAERIVRTEGAYLHGAAKQATLKAVEKEAGTKLYKRIVETFDDRTGDDSFLIHGQVQEVGKPFSYKRRSKGGWKLVFFAHPPNRPNDRATMIGWDPSWDETELERPLSLSELRAARTTRWRKTVGVRIPPGHVPGKPYGGKPSKVEAVEDDEGESGED